jgi:hypothetical protein
LRSHPWCMADRLENGGKKQTHPQTRFTRFSAFFPLLVARQAGSLKGYQISPPHAFSQVVARQAMA